MMVYTPILPTVSSMLGRYQKVAAAISVPGAFADIADAAPAVTRASLVDPIVQRMLSTETAAPLPAPSTPAAPVDSSLFDTIRYGLTQNAALSPWATGLGAAGAGALGAALPYMVAPSVFNRRSPWYYHLAPAALGAGGALAGAMYTPDIVNSISGLLS